jgi:cytoskeleton protein RodZ
MPSFGETLRRERELRQISLREISEATKINLRYLEALERDDFRHLPGGVFNKGFVRAFAQFIGIDADAMVMAYLDEERSQEARSSRPAGAPAVSTEPPPATAPAGVRWWVATLIAVLVLLVVAAGLTALGYGPLASKFKSLRGDVARTEAAERPA